MKKGGLIWSIWNFIEAALLLTMGILVIANCTNKDIQSSVFIVISIFLMVGGLLKIVMRPPHLGQRPGISMTSGDPAAIINVIMNFVVWLVSVLLMAAGASLIAFAIGFIVSKLYKLYMPVIEIILGALLIGAGVTIIILFTNNSDIVMSIMLVIVGLALAVAAVFKIISVVKAIIKAKEEKEPDENVFDTEVSEAKA